MERLIGGAKQKSIDEIMLGMGLSGGQIRKLKKMMGGKRFIAEEDIKPEIRFSSKRADVGADYSKMRRGVFEPVPKSEEKIAEFKKLIKKGEPKRIYRESLPRVELPVLEPIRSEPEMMPEGRGRHRKMKGGARITNPVQGEMMGDVVIDPFFGAIGTLSGGGMLNISHGGAISGGKRKPSAWNLFYKKNFAKVKAKMGGAPASEVMKEIAKMYRK
jgi:hypothetical protein